MPKTESIQFIAEGALLSEPVLNNYGQALIAAGTSLTLRHINLLKTWNINFVTIQTEDSISAECEVNPEVREIAQKRLEKRMKWSSRNFNENDLIQLGFLATIDHILKK